MRITLKESAVVERLGAKITFAAGCTYDPDTDIADELRAKGVLLEDEQPSKEAPAVAPPVGFGGEE